MIWLAVKVQRIGSMLWSDIGMFRRLGPEHFVKDVMELNTKNARRGHP